MNSIARKMVLLVAVGLLITLGVFFPSRSTYAQALGYVTIGFGELNPITIGRTVRLGITISNSSPHPIRSTSFTCSQTGTSLSGQSISRLPGTIPANGFFSSEQYYRAVSAGSTTVQCTLNGIDTVTNTPVSIVSNSDGVSVISETRLTVEASGAQVGTVGQTIYLIVNYSNRGQTAFTNVTATCDQLGRGIAFVGSRQSGGSTLPGGQSGFVQYQLQGQFVGASGDFLCKVMATDSSTGQSVTVNAPTFHIDIR